MPEILIKLLKKPVFWLILALMAALSVCAVQRSRIGRITRENERYSANQTALLTEMKTLETENGDLMNQVQTVTLQRDEVKELLPKYESELKNLRIRLKDAEALAHVNTETIVEVEVPAKEVIKYVQVRDSTARLFHWSDDWVTVDCLILPDTVNCGVHVVDSLTLVRHRERRKCLFKKPAETFTVTSANPHTTITGMDFVTVVEGK